ncbi:hypothetical protein SESBI_50734 [Sesbania bispinosa]|nr:hypothetical protein SESBI_50734 [Sesbania bispinosa]
MTSWLKEASRRTQEDLSSSKAFTKRWKTTVFAQSPNDEFSCQGGENKGTDKLLPLPLTFSHL